MPAARVFIDRQLAGPYGSARRPSTCGRRSRTARRSRASSRPLTPAQRYRKGLAALDKYCRETFAGKSFAELSDAQKDE